MSGPLIPYIEAPEIPLSFLKYLPIISQYVDAADPPSIKPFGTLVALGVYVGSVVAMNHTKERGLDSKKMSDFIFWVVASGFVLSHMIDAVAYHPQTVLKDPLYLFRIWDGLSSYGGFIGAVVGAVAWKLYRRDNILELIDMAVSAFPLAWVFGRSGCAVVHDHPGALSNAWFAVKYPPHTLQAGFDGRYDLGLIEMVLTIPLAVACLYLWRRKPLRAPGFYIGLSLSAYAPVRFFLDFLRVTPDDRVFTGATDIRWAGLTFAQWACFLALGVGGFFLLKTWNAPYVRTGPAAPPEPGPEAGTGADAPADAPKKKRKKKTKKKAPVAPEGREAER